VGGFGLDPSGPGCGPVADHCEHDSELSGSMKGSEFLDYLSDC